MTHGAHCVDIRDHGAVGRFKWCFCGALRLTELTTVGALAFGARPPGLGDQRHSALAFSKGACRLGDMVDVRRAPALGSVQMLQFQTQVFDYREWSDSLGLPAWQIPSAEIPVDIRNAQSSIP